MTPDQQPRPDPFRRAEFDAFARTLGAVPVPYMPRPGGRPPGRPGPSPEYLQMVRDARAFFGGNLRAGLTAMLAPYRVTDTHHLTPAQCAEISEKIELMASMSPLGTREEHADAKERVDECC